MRKTMLGVVLALAALAGCAGPERTGELAQGLTVLEETPTSLSVAYRRGDQVIYAEALRGEPTPEPYQSDPQSPDFQMDARFLAADGYAFYSHRGADGFIDDSWGEDRERQSALPTRDGNNAWMFELATEMSAALPDALVEQLGQESAAAHAPELGVIVTFGARATEEYEAAVVEFREMREREVALAETGQLPGTIDGSPRGSVAYGDLGGADELDRALPQNYYYISHHTGPIDFAWLCGGYHSASRVYEWRSGAWASVHENANHGRGPSGSGMSQAGLLQYYEALSDYHPNWTVRTCGTGYDALSNGGGHNCHDDVRIQMNNFVYNSAIGGSQYWCGDGDGSADYSCGTEGGAPTANSRGRSGYNYPSRCAYNFSSSCPASYQGTGDGCDCGCIFPDGTGADPDCRY